MVYFSELRKDRFWLSCSFQNEDKEKERKRQQEPQAARTNSPKTDADQEEEEDDSDHEPDNTRQTPENPSSGKRQTTKTFSNFSRFVYYYIQLCGWDLLCARLTG